MTIGTDVIVISFVLRLMWIQEYVPRLPLDPELAMQMFKLIPIGEISPLVGPFMRVGLFIRIKDRVNSRISHVIADRRMKLSHDLLASFNLFTSPNLSQASKVIKDRPNLSLLLRSWLLLIQDP